MLATKRTSQWTSFVDSNKTSIKPGCTLVHAIISVVKEKRSKSNNTYFFCVFSVLNQKQIFLKYDEKSLQPETKKIKTDDEVEAETGPKQVGVTIAPGTELKANSFSRDVGNLKSGDLVQLSISASEHNGASSFKVDEVVKDSNNSITALKWESIVSKCPISTIPTMHNIPDSEDPYANRKFVLPLSQDNNRYNVDIILPEMTDCENFWGKCKEPSKYWRDISNPETKFPSVNSKVGEKTRNMLNVVYTDKENKNATYVKFEYNPNVWSGFGFTKWKIWAKCAGRMISYADSWYAFGVSSLKQIRSMTANASADSGYDFGECDNDFPNYEECEKSSTGEVQAPENRDVTESTTGFVINMNLNLLQTVKNCGIKMSLDFVREALAKNEEEDNPDERIENTINAAWMLRLRRGHSTVFNVTEMDKYSQGPFLDEAQNKKNLHFYGVYAVGNDEPYEKALQNDDSFESWAKEQKAYPSCVFAVIVNDST